MFNPFGFVTGGAVSPGGEERKRSASLTLLPPVNREETDRRRVGPQLEGARPACASCWWQDSASVAPLREHGGGGKRAARAPCFGRVLCDRRCRRSAGEAFPQHSRWEEKTSRPYPANPPPHAAQKRGERGGLATPMCGERLGRDPNQSLQLGLILPSPSFSNPLNNDLNRYPSTPFPLPLPPLRQTTSSTF